MKNKRKTISLVIIFAVLMPLFIVSAVFLNPDLGTQFYDSLDECVREWNNGIFENDELENYTQVDTIVDVIEKDDYAFVIEVDDDGFECIIVKVKESMFGKRKYGANECFGCDFDHQSYYMGADDFVFKRNDKNVVCGMRKSDGKSVYVNGEKAISEDYSYVRKGGRRKGKEYKFSFWYYEIPKDEKPTVTLK